MPCVHLKNSGFWGDCFHVISIKTILKVLIIRQKIIKWFWIYWGLSICVLWLLPLLSKCFSIGVWLWMRMWVWMPILDVAKCYFHYCRHFHCCHHCRFHSYYFNHHSPIPHPYLPPFLSMLLLPLLLSWLPTTAPEASPDSKILMTCPVWHCKL